MSEQVPEGWKKTHLSDFSTARRGTTYVSSELSEDKERFPLYINMKSFKVGGGYSENGDKYYSSPYLPNQLVQDNDLLIANTDVTDSCDILGAPVYLPRDKLKNDVLFSHHVSALNISDDVSLNFLNFLMCSEHIRLEMKRYGRGTTVKMLDMRDIGKISLSLPPLPEQKKIASILTSVDEVIEKTQSQINKLQYLKKGTMNELLTKGIGHTEFKDSELGRIPKSWEVKTLGSLSIGGARNGLYLPSDFYGSGVEMVHMTEVFNSEVITSGNMKRVNLSEQQKDTFSLEKGDLVFARRSLVLEGAGKCSIIGDVIEPLSFESSIIRLRPNQNSALGLHIYYYLSSDFGKRAMLKIARQVAVSGITGEDLLTLNIPVPSISEQNQEINILQGFDDRISVRIKTLQKFESLKKSLMQDLLTGKVRVSVN